MFRQSETLLLFSLTAVLATLITRVLQDWQSIGIVPAFVIGCPVGFFISCLVTAVFAKTFNW